VKIRRGPATVRRKSAGKCHLPGEGAGQAMIFEPGDLLVFLPGNPTTDGRPGTIIWL